MQFCSNVSVQTHLNTLSSALQSQWSVTSNYMVYQAEIGSNIFSSSNGLSLNSKYSHTNEVQNSLKAPDKIIKTYLFVTISGH